MINSEFTKKYLDGRILSKFKNILPANINLYIRIDKYSIYQYNYIIYL